MALRSGIIMVYRKRIADTILERKLKGAGAVLIEGCKWCGKTTMAEQIAKSVIYLDDPDNRERNLLLAETSPKLLLRGASPKLIDEWQLAPKLWDAIRFDVDHRDDLGCYILTGSSVPVDESEIYHSGTGRYSYLSLRPMSLYESGDSSGEISLRDLFDGKAEGAISSSPRDLEEIAFLTCRGGWPRAIGMEREIALDQAFDYRDSLLHKDLSKASGAKKDPEKARAVMRSYSRLLGSQAPIRDINEDVREWGYSSSDEETVSSYLSALRAVFALEDAPAWNPNLRSKTAIRTSPTRYFVDPSIAAASLELGPADLLNDMNTFGLLFENLVVRDLRIYAEALLGSVSHYRDRNGLETDAVIHIRGGKFGLAEIKLGGERAIEDGAKRLKELASKLDPKKMKEPSFMMVIVASGDIAYKREDGVFVVPIAMLRD